MCMSVCLYYRRSTLYHTAAEATRLCQLQRENPTFLHQTPVTCCVITMKSDSLLRQSR